MSKLSGRILMDDVVWILCPWLQTTSSKSDSAQGVWATSVERNLPTVRIPDTDYQHCLKTSTSVPTHELCLFTDFSVPKRRRQYPQRSYAHLHRHTHTKITMVADGDASVTKKLGLVLDTGAFGGVRSKRYAMLVEDGTVKELDVCATTHGHVIFQLWM